MKIFTQNAKMKKSTKVVYNFGIPAFQSADGTRTCPNAGACAAGCYARSGAYAWSNVQNAYEQRLALTKRDTFLVEVQFALDVLKKKHAELYIRIHDSGDFYSEEYQLAWYYLALQNPTVQFYAYTKQVLQSKSIETLKPDNFTLIYSYGGKQDAYITESDRHSKVFESNVPDNYIDASDDDMLALTKNVNVALVYHGAKSFKNTLWSKTV